MSKRAAILAAEIEPMMQVYVSTETPAHVVVAEVAHVTRGKNRGKTCVRRHASTRWIWLDSDKTYPLIKERT